MARPRKRPALAVKTENVQDEKPGNAEAEAEAEAEVKAVVKPEPQSPISPVLQLSEEEFLRRAQELCEESDRGRKRSPKPPGGNFHEASCLEEA